MTAQKARIVLLTEDPEVARYEEFYQEEHVLVLIEALRYRPETPQFVDRIASLRTDILIFGPDIEARDILTAASQLRLTHPEVECVAYHAAPTDFVVEALRSGVRDVIDPDDGLDKLHDVVNLLHRAATVRRDHLLAAHSGDETGRTIVLVAPKGGVGKSTVAVNLAYALAVNAPNEVVLVDLDLFAGDVADMLQVEANSNVAIAARSGAVHDPATLKLSLTAHPAGMLVLAAPTSLVEASEVDIDELSELLELLGQLFRYVVIDTGPGAPDAAIAAVRNCSDLLAVTTPDLGGIKALDRYLEALATIGLEWPRTHFVLNRFDRRAGMTREDVEGVLGRPIDVILNQDRQVPAAANQGVPYLQMRPRGSLAGGFGGLVQRFAVAPAAAMAPAKNWFK